MFVSECLSGSFPLANMSKWLPLWEEQQEYGIDESTPSISSSHQISPKVTWSLQVYLGIMNLTLILSSVQVVMLIGEIMILIMRVTGSSLKENFQDGVEGDQLLPTIRSTGCHPDWNIITLQDLGQCLNQDTGTHPHTGHPAQVEIVLGQTPH